MLLDLLGWDTTDHSVVQGQSTVLHVMGGTFWPCFWKYPQLLLVSPIVFFFHIVSLYVWETHKESLWWFGVLSPVTLKSWITEGIKVLGQSPEADRLPGPWAHSFPCQTSLLLGVKPVALCFVVFLAKTAYGILRFLSWWQCQIAILGWWSSVFVRSLRMFWFCCSTTTPPLSSSWAHNIVLVAILSCCG